MGARAALRGLQREEGEAGAAGEPLVQAAGHPEWHLPHRLLRQACTHWQDAHPASDWWKGACDSQHFWDRAGTTTGEEMGPPTMEG